MIRSLFNVNTRRQILAVIGASTIPFFTGCLGSSSGAEIEHLGSNSRVVRVPTAGTNPRINERISSFYASVPSGTNASIDINLTKGGFIFILIERITEDDSGNEIVSGSGSAILFSDSEYEKFEQNESASGASTVVNEDEASSSTPEFQINKTKQTLVVMNRGRQETETEKTLRSRVDIVEKIPLARRFTSPVVPR